MDGLYKFLTYYNDSKDFDLLAVAPNVYFDFSECQGATYAIQNRGTLTRLPDLTANVVKSSSMITLSNTNGISEGDWICLYNPTNFSYSKFREYYRAGEWIKVLSVSNNIIKTASPIYESYQAADMQVYKLNSVKCHIKGIKILNNSTTLAGSILFGLSSDTKVSIKDALCQQESVVLFDRCIKPFSVGCYGINKGASSDDYFISIANCQHARHIGGDIYSRRHAVALGGNDQLCSVPTRDFRSQAGAILRNDPESTVGAADMHGNVAHSSYDDCIIYGGSNIGGGDECYYRRCKIISDPYGRIGFTREVLGGNHGWIDCEGTVIADPQKTSGRGIFDFGGNSSVYNSYTEKNSTIILNKIVLNSDVPFELNSVSMAKLVNRGTRQKINANIDDITLNFSQPIYNIFTLSIDTTDNTIEPTSDYLIVDNIKGKKPTGYYCATTTINGKSYTNMPMRLPRISGSTTIVTADASQCLSPTVNLPASYKKYKLSLTPRGVDGATINSFGGKKNPCLSVATQGLSSFKAQLTSDTNFTAGETIEIMYEATIREC